MGFMDKMKQMAGKNPEKVNKGLKTASDKVNERTGGKYSDKIDQNTEQARGYLGTEGGGEGQDQEGQAPQGQGPHGQEGQAPQGQGPQGQEGQGQQQDQQGQQGQQRGGA